jgi:ubiquinone/menaquinone biosynthesis C-methylase UbiE
MARAALEVQVTRHYSQNGLEQAILAALRASGRDIGRLTPLDLAPVDEFHTAGRQATADLAERVDFAPGMHILDVGCGIGGASRFFATAKGCRVTGIDLTQDYVDTAAALAQRVGLGGQITYRQASALALPFERAAFDGAYMMHVGMNVADKPALFAEIRRVLKPGSQFAIFDIMRTGNGELSFPVHWAPTAAQSFVASPQDYRAALEAAGFEIAKERDRGDFARTFFKEVAARNAESGGPPPLGVHILMKEDIGRKLTNVTAALESRAIAPVELVCVAR